MVDKRKRKDLLIWESRILRIAFACGILAALLFFISFCAEYWIWIEFPTTQERNDPDRTEPKPFYKKGHYHGLWKICRQEYHNATTDNAYDHTYCRSMYFTLPPTIEEKFVEIETQIMLTVETLGSWNSERLELIGDIGHRTTLVTGDTQETSFLVQRMAVAVQRGNAVSVKGTLPLAVYINA